MEVALHSYNGAMSARSRSTQAGNIRTTLIILLAAMAAAAGFALAAFLSRPAFDPADLSSVRVFPQPRAVADFALETGTGEAFGPDALKDHWTLVYFGFVNCPDICPTTLLTLADIHDKVSNLHPTLQVVFVSVDPDRDRGEVLEQYVTHFNPEFIGVTGDDLALQALARQFGIAYVRNEPAEPGGNYTVDHTAAIVLVDPELRYHAALPAPHDTAVIIEELTQLLTHRRDG